MATNPPSTVTGKLFGTARAMATETAVPSFTDPHKTYEVHDAFQPWASCGCPDFQYRRAVCKHIAFARKAIEQLVDLSRTLNAEINDPLVTDRPLRVVPPEDTRAEPG